MASFKTRLNYSFGNEDWETEHQALQIGPGDRVLCVTGSGDRPLHTLLDNCDEVVAIDMNKMQNDLLQLKMTAMQELNFNEYLAFLGALPSKNRSEVLNKISHKMPLGARETWKNNQKLIEKGILYQGAVEQLTNIIAKFFKLLRGKKTEKLFEFKDLTQQQKFVDQTWDTKTLRIAFDCIIRPNVMGRISGDPGLRMFIGPSISMGDYVYDRMLNCLKKNLACESPLLSLLLKGKVAPEGYPPYLTEKGYEIIRTRLDRIRIVTDNLISYLEKCPKNYFDAFSISDVASYITEEDFLRLITQIHRTAKKGARFSIREFLSTRTFPQKFLIDFQRNSNLEKKLEQEDRCFVYRYMVGKIHTSPCVKK